MTNVMRSKVLPLVIIAIIIWSQVGSIPGFVGVLLPFALVAAFWVFLYSQRRRALAAPPEQNDIVTRVFSFPWPFGKRGEDKAASTSARDLEQPSDISALSKKVGLSD